MDALTATGYTSNPPSGGEGGGGPVAWADITGKPSTFTPAAHTQAASTISDSTAVGRSVLTAADAAAARTAIGAGTSSLALGSTGSTAAAGNHGHVPGDVTGLTESVQDTVGAMVVAGANVTATYDDGAGTLTIAAAGGGGGGSSMTVKRATVTSGNLSLAVSVPWVAVAGGPSLAIPAAVGDYVEFQVVSYLGNFGVNFLDMAIQAGGNLVRFMSSGTATAATEGAPAFYGDQSFDRGSPVFEFVVEAGDLSGGNVTAVLATKGSGGGTVYASTDYPFRWRAINHGAVSVS